MAHTPTVLLPALLLLGSSLLAGCQGAGRPAPESAALETPMVEAPSEPFGGEVGTCTFTHWLEDGHAVFGTVFIGPPVLLEKSTSMFEAGARLVPIAYTCILVKSGEYLSDDGGFYYRDAMTSKPFLLLLKTAEFTGEVGFGPRDDLTWEEVDHQDDLLITVTDL